MKKKAAKAAGPTLVSGAVRLVPIDSIEPHPENPRESDLGAIIESIEVNGFYGKVLCQDRGEGKKPRIIVGEHRWRAAKEVGLKQVPVEIISVSDEAARKIMLVDNKTQNLADEDEALLTELLQSIVEDEGLIGLDGTGYDGDSLDMLLEQHGVHVSDAASRPLVSPMSTKRPPALTWVLVGIPTVQFGSIAQDVEKMAAFPGVICEMCVADEVME